jgi:phage-related minor tail protein
MTKTIESTAQDVITSGEQVKQSLAEMSALGDQFASKLMNSFEQVAVRGKKLEDVVKSLGQNLAQLALKAALKPLEGAFGSVFSQLLGGLGGSLTPGAGTGLQPFANGGVISSPITFPLADGRAAIAGEQGAEAILPLTRGADGQLGVRSAGGGGGANITFNISTPDVAGFQRSQTQIAAMLQRGLSVGQRNQ